MQHFFKLVLFIFMLAGKYVCAQQNAEVSRPKIGLALSGGGAKGLSHIGALMVIEKAGIKIDYIVGTSMGSVIGALYAIGYSPDSIAAIARGEDWDILLANNPGLRQISIEEKADYSRYLIEIPFEARRFKLPRGVIDGQELSVELTRLTFPVYNKKRFTEFPIPFKCVATDITNGEVVLLDSGNIADAIRSSMAIPSIFTPVKYQNRLLVDGGIVRNFPVEHVKEMGADIIIGVNLSKGFLQETELENIIDILNQSMFLSDGDDTRKQRELCDYLIEPDLTGYHAGSFDATDSLIKRGYDAAMLIYDDLKKLADRLNAKYGVPAKIAIPKIDSVLLTGFDVEGISNANRDLVIDRLDLNRNRWYKPDVFPRSMKKVYGTRYFRKVGYELFEHEDGTKMLLKGFENPTTFFNIALNYNSFTKASFISNVTSRNLFSKNSRFSATLNIADMFRFKTEYFKYVGEAKNHGVGFSASFDNYDLPIYEQLNRTALYKQKHTSFDIRYQIASLTVNTLSAGIKQEINQFTPDVYGFVNMFDGSIAQNKAYLAFGLNTLDRHYYPRSGSTVLIDLGYVFNPITNLSLVTRDSVSDQFSTRKISGKDLDSLLTKRYLQVKIIANRHDKVANRSILISGVYVGLSWNPMDPRGNVNTIYNNFMLGGLIPNFHHQIPVIGLGDFQVRTNNYVGFMLSLQYELYKNLHITPRLSGGVQNPNTSRLFTSNDALQSSNQLLGYGLSAGFNSFLGPIDFTIMRNTQLKSFVFYVNMGHIF